ncbi:hypothetical protein [Embleya sp. NPDC050493]|uniref:hypothetical protein n=1 Tax=Embleya sp. NPDC050493 TaxID=3363989 RepID=UPI003796762C
MAGEGIATGDGFASTSAGNVPRAHDVGVDNATAALASWPTPRQVPPSHRDFVNRVAELALLEEFVAHAMDGPGPVVAVLTGLGGVGKTALGAHWAWLAAARFPDGQLYADLGQSRYEGAIDVGGVLGTFLRSLGVHESRIPPTPGGRAALFRSVTAGRRLLVFVDNVDHAAEVRALLPASGMVIATSRNRIGALILDGARPVPLDPLGVTAGSDLVRRWLGESRAADAELAEMVRLCGGLPLALRAVGARLIARRRLSVHRVLAELADEHTGLDALTGPEGAGVDRAFDAVYSSFSPTAQRLYRVLGIHPGPTFTSALAIAAAGEDDAAALDDLWDAHLVEEIEEDGSRYRFHDVARVHARRCGRSDPEPARETVLRRIVEFYRVTADAADRLVLGPRLRLGTAPEPPSTTAPVPRPSFPGRAEALTWLDDERSNLLAVLRAAAERGWHDAVWRLCESLWALYHSRKHYADWIESHQLGIAAAQWEGRPDAEVRMRNQLARAFHELRDYDRAETELRGAEDLLGVVDDARLSGVVWETRGLLELAGDRPEKAVALFTRAREANVGDTHGVLVQSYNLGQALIAATRYDEALTLLDEAAAKAEATGDHAMRPRIDLVRGQAYRGLGAVDEAITCLSDAVRTASELGLYAKEAQALEALVDIAAQTHAADVESAGRERLRVLYRELGVGRPDTAPDRS